MADATPQAKFQVSPLPLAGSEAPWDEFVHRSPESNPFATSAWLRESAAVSGAEIELWVAAKGQEWIAGVPITLRRRFGLPLHFGLPLAAYNSYLYRPREGVSAMRATSEHLEVTRALLDGMGSRAHLLNHLLVPEIDDVRPWTWKGWRAWPRYTYRLDVASPLPVSDSVRRHLRKCAEAGFRVSWDWDLERHWGAFEETRERQGFGLRLGRDAFFSLGHALHAAGLAWMGTALAPGGEAASSLIVLGIPGGPGVFMWTGGGRSTYLSSGVNSWLMVEIAAEAGRRGHRFWDLCGADLPSVARFKSELGGSLAHYFQIEAPHGALDRGLSLARWLLRGPG